MTLTEDIDRRVQTYLDEDAPTPVAPFEPVQAQELYQRIHQDAKHTYAAVANPQQIPPGIPKSILRSMWGKIARGQFGRWTMQGRVFFRNPQNELRHITYPLHRKTRFKYDLLTYHRKHWAYVFSVNSSEDPLFKAATQEAVNLGCKWALVHAETGFVIEEGEAGRMGCYGSEPGGR